MAKLSTELLILCDHALISQDGKLSLIGLFNQIFVHRLPTRFLKLFIVAIFSGSPSVQHQLTLDITAPDGKTIESKQIALKLGKNGKANFLTALHGLPLPLTGNYILTFKLDKKLIAQKDFQVINVKPAQSLSPLPN